MPNIRVSLSDLPFKVQIDMLFRAEEMLNDCPGMDRVELIIPMGLSEGYCRTVVIPRPKVWRRNLYTI